MLQEMVEASAERYAENATLDTALMEQLGPIEVVRFLRDAEGTVVIMVEGYLARRPGRFCGDGVAAFVAVHALRGVLMAAAAHGPLLLRAPGFRQELVRMLERFLCR